MSGYVPFLKLSLEQQVAANSVERTNGHERLPLAEYEFGIRDDGSLTGTYQPLRSERQRLSDLIFGRDVPPDRHAIVGNYTALPRGAGFHLDRK